MAPKQTFSVALEGGVEVFALSMEAGEKQSELPHVLLLLKLKIDLFCGWGWWWGDGGDVTIDGGITWGSRRAAAPGVGVTVLAPAHNW